jgi:hypothetical protein
MHSVSFLSAGAGGGFFQSLAIRNTHSQKNQAFSSVPTKLTGIELSGPAGGNEAVITQSTNKNSLLFRIKRQVFASPCLAV